MRVNSICKSPFKQSLLKLFCSLSLFFIVIQAHAQQSIDSVLSKEASQIIPRLETNKDASLNYYKLYKYRKNLLDSSINLSERSKQFMDSYEDSYVPYKSGEKLATILFYLEKDNYQTDELRPISIRLINEVPSLKALYILMRAVLNRLDLNSSTQEESIREKLIDQIAKQMVLLSDNRQAWYNYNTVRKKGVKGFLVKYDNDLNNLGIFQHNSDVDYTGGLELALATDLFKINGLFPSKSYQKILYGGKVFTPLYQGFQTDSSYNIYDRPHASFQYLGYEINGLSNTDLWRWTAAFRLGIIGGRFGYNFQYYLHKDISISPYPYGWDAQIAFPGRLSLQANMKMERLLFKKDAERKSAQWGIIPSGSLEAAIGHYMTYYEAGLNISSHNFAHKNQDQILAKNLYYGGKGVSWNTAWYYQLNFRLRHVLHNSMLEGHGVFSDNEGAEGTYAEPSVHKLKSDQVRKLLVHSSFTVGFQTSLFNFYYEYVIKSPEVNIDNAVKIRGRSINNRWHNYARLGLGFTF